MSRKGNKVMNNKNKTIYSRLRIIKKRRCMTPHNTSSYLINISEGLKSESNSNLELYCNRDLSLDNRESNDLEDIYLSENIEVGRSMMGMLNTYKQDDVEVTESNRETYENEFSKNKPLFYFHQKNIVQNFQ